MIDRLFQSKEVPVTQADHDDLAAQLREALNKIIRLQTMVEIHQQELQEAQRQIGAMREAAGAVSAANEAQRHALATQRKLIDEMGAEVKGLTVDLNHVREHAHKVEEENAALRNDVVFWYVIANEYKKELELAGIVKSTIEHNGFKC